MPCGHNRIWEDSDELLRTGKKPAHKCCGKSVDEVLEREKEAKNARMNYEMGIGRTISTGYEGSKIYINGGNQIPNIAMVCLFDEFFQQWQSTFGKDTYLVTNKIVTDSKELPQHASCIGDQAYLGVVQGKLLTYATKSTDITPDLVKPIRRVSSLIACTEDWKGDWGNEKTAKQFFLNFWVFHTTQDFDAIKKGAKSRIVKDLCERRTICDDLHLDIRSFYNL